MSLNLRVGTPDDAIRCGTIFYEAFKAIADQHNFPPDIPSPEIGQRVFASRPRGCMLPRGHIADLSNMVSGDKKAKVAREMGISRKTLYQYLHQA